MTAVVQLPEIKSVRDVLAALLARDVEVLLIDMWAPEPQEPIAVASLVDDDWWPNVYVMLDLPAAVFLGGALGLTPVGAAQDMVRNQQIAPAVLENLYEVINVLTSTLNARSEVHVQIADFYEPGTTATAEAIEVLSRSSGRLDLHLRVHGYGAGRLALVGPCRSKRR
jgi:hypothetical protein